MILTKKYRLVWNPETLEVIGFPMEEHVGSETIVGFGMESFESDELSDIISKLEGNIEDCMKANPHLKLKENGGENY